VEGNNAQVAIWRANGTFDRTIGQRGDGPGELGPGTAPLKVFVDARDRVYVRASQGRWSVFSRDLRFVRGIRVRSSGLRAVTAVLDDGRILISDPPFQEGVRRFAVIGMIGAAEQAFGELEPQPTSMEMRTHPSVVIGSEASFFSGPPSDGTAGYVLDEWSLLGNKTASYRRAAEWLSASERNSGSARSRRRISSGKSPPGLAIRPVNVDHDGLVLTYVWVPNANWREVTRSEQNKDPNRLSFNLHIEVLDPRAGTILASEVVNSVAVADGAIPLEYFDGTRLGYRHGRGADGLPVVSIVEYSLVSSK
jgi:hypothetical protein